jgi:hypothetical protein
MPIGDGEHINNTVRTGSMDDVGTRLKFMTELYELWTTGLDIMTRYERNSAFYDEKRIELEHAIKMLYFHIQKDYNEEPYKKEINNNTETRES